MWTIDNIVRNSKGAQKDGVVEVMATYTKTDGDYIASYPACATFTPDKNKEGFVSWSSLTAEIVEGWMETASDMTFINEFLTEEIAKQKSKTTGLPW